MESGDEGEELKCDRLHHPGGGLSKRVRGPLQQGYIEQVEPTGAGDEQGGCQEGGGATHARVL